MRYKTDYLNFKEMDKSLAVYSKFKRKCEHCGHIRLVTKQKPIVICNWCGHKIYYDDKTKFKDLLKFKL